MISEIIKVSVSVISVRLRLITLTSTLIIPDITKTSSNNCLYFKQSYPSLDHDYHQGGIHMTNVGLMLKTIRLSWILRLLAHANSSWNSVPDFFLRRLGGLNFLLGCNYDAILLHLKLPTLYKDLLSFFDDPKALYNKKN